MNETNIIYLYKNITAFTNKILGKSNVTQGNEN